ncbi:FeGP cofactor biosynthesis guanylyltransferase HcgB family protein [Methanocaldococcus indicus]|uniref:FeGP cofactor biosynthesis guanylyltransferase HcgB family protein n=1 Tax=Methanocaldococcus indicus TaxID=213231 RepID=UPI003C6D2A9D
MEEIVKKAYLESINKERKGDKIEETEYIKNKILSAKKIVVATNNTKKFNIIKSILEKVCNAEIKMIDIPTDVADLTRIPALTKIYLAIDTEDGDIFIGRGRLGAPGSGALFIIADSKGRILTASISPPSHIHKKPIEEKIKDEILDALRRVGVEI